MPNIWVVLLYGVVVSLAVFLLWYFSAQAWYWHVLSLAAALALGLMPAPVGWQGPAFDVLFGSVFLFLIVWGVGGMVTYRSHRASHKHA